MKRIAVAALFVFSTVAHTVIPPAVYQQAREDAPYHVEIIEAVSDAPHIPVD